MLWSAVACRSAPKRRRLAISSKAVDFGTGTETSPLAVLFPGQGSQYVGMLRDLACSFPIVHRTLADASAPEPIDGQSLGDWIYPHPSFDADSRQQAERSLRSTQIAQPAIGAVSLGAYRLLEEFGVRPDAVAGHSFGELTALCAAGRIDERSFFELARLRGRLMAGDGGDRGAMLAVLAPIEAIESTVLAEKLDLVVANRNAPRQTILSGSSSEIARAATVFSGQRISTRPLDVSAAFHSQFVAEASVGLLEALESIEFTPSKLPVFANTTAEPYPKDPGAARTLIAEQLARPVRFVEQIEAMYRSGIRTFLEVGPDSRLTGLVDAILEGRDHTSLALDASRGKRGNVLDLARSLAQLAAIGHPIRLDLWDEGAEARSSVGRKPGLTVKVSGANFAPKPPPTKTARHSHPRHSDSGTAAQDDAQTRRSTRPPNPNDLGRRSPRTAQRLDDPADRQRPGRRRYQADRPADSGPGSGVLPRRGPPRFPGKPRRPPADRRADQPAPPPVPRRPGPGAADFPVAPRTPAEADPGRDRPGSDSARTRRP